MAQYSLTINPTITTSTTQLNNFGVYATTVGAVALVKEFSWGGGDITLISQRTRWARWTNTPATPTAITSSIEMTNGAAGPAAIYIAASTFTTQPTATAGKNLHDQFWNSQGGGGVVVLPQGGEWMCVGAALGTNGNNVACGQVTGSGTNISLGIQWAE